MLLENLPLRAIGSLLQYAGLPFLWRIEAVSRRSRKLARKAHVPLDLTTLPFEARLPPSLSDKLKLDLVRVRGGASMHALRPIVGIRLRREGNTKLKAHAIESLRDEVPAIESIEVCASNASQCSLALLAGFEELRRLCVRATMMRGELRSLSGLAHLRVLDLECCSAVVGNLGDVSSLSCLEHIDLSGCRRIRGDLADLRGLVRLEVVNLCYLHLVKGDVRSLCALQRLRHVDIGWCRKLVGDLNSLFELSLHFLNVSYCVELSGVKGFEQLNPHCRVVSQRFYRAITAPLLPFVL